MTAYLLWTTRNGQRQWEQHRDTGAARSAAQTNLHCQDGYQVALPADAGDGTGLTAVSARALAYALNDFADELGIEVAWLDDANLRLLAESADRLRDAAQDELDGRLGDDHH